MISQVVLIFMREYLTTLIERCLYISFAYDASAGLDHGDFFLLLPGPSFSLPSYPHGCLTFVFLIPSRKGTPPFNPVSSIPRHPSLIQLLCNIIVWTYDVE